jgi:hypothetical protein
VIASSASKQNRLRAEVNSTEVRNCVWPTAAPLVSINTLCANSELGPDHERLAFYHNGIQRRLAGVHGHVIHEILSYNDSSVAAVL